MSNKRIKLLIANNDHFLINNLKDKLLNEDDIYITSSTNNGIDAINLIKKLSPDIVLLDIVLANTDGLSILEYFAYYEITKKPNFIILTSMAKDEIIRKSMELGASYYILKPVDNDIILKRIKETYNERLETLRKNGYLTVDTDSNYISESKLEQNMIRILHNLGIPPKLNGYRYICEGVKIATVDKTSLDSITKCLYPQIAKIHNTKPSSVERAIRHALDAAWSKGCEQTYNILFSFPQNRNKKRPTNREFIFTVIEYLDQRKKSN